MEPEQNCSSQCDSPRCFIHSGVHRQVSLDVLQRLCSLSTTVAELPRRSLSPVLSAVVWTLLSGGVLLAFCFLLFTLRFKNNRIVKMSSPNLNILTLFGSLLTYTSGFLFAVDARPHSQLGASTAVLQARVWALCVGSTLVFGPILGKTWRLYRVFTQRVPDKRVIIRDIQLMGMVALLILVDLLVLTAWNLSDPIRCSRSIGAVVKVVEKDISYSLSLLDTCSSMYSHLWVVILAVKKGCLLLYGTYLAGLTSNVSHPPVNQSPTIITAVTLVTLSSTVAIPVSIFLQAWPNLVYSTVAGAIFICTLATNCMLFVPQLSEWRQFEDEQNSSSQMAKYFSSPSKSHTSAYSQDEIYYLLGENSSMKKLLSEKNAVIDSLQEQVNNAKDKLLRLMSASQPSEDADSCNIHSSSTQTTDLQSSSPSASLPHRDTGSPLSTSHLSPLVSSSSEVLPPSSHLPAPNPTTPTAASHPLPDDTEAVSVPTTSAEDTYQRSGPMDFTPPVSPQPSGLLRTAEETANFVTSLQYPSGLTPCEIESLSNGLRSPLRANGRLTGFVSNEQLQEILQELSVDATMETALKSFSHTPRTPSQLKFPEDTPLSPLSLRTPRSTNPPIVFRYPSISPYAMRKRRPPFRSSRRRPTPPCFYTGPEADGCGRTSCAAQVQGRRPEAASVDGGTLQVEDEEAEGHEGHRCVSRSRRHSEHNHPSDVEVGGDGEQRHRHFRDSCRYWDSDSSSSTDFCFYHRPYCESCFQRGSLLSSDTSSDSSDSEYEGFSLYRPPHPVVFKEDLKPTFV